MTAHSAKLPSVRLTKIASTHNNVRTPTVDGVTPTWPPEVGQPFVLWGEGLEDKEKTRQIITTPIKDVHPFPPLSAVTVFEVKTENSTYRLELIADLDKQPEPPAVIVVQIGGE